MKRAIISTGLGRLTNRCCTEKSKTKGKPTQRGGGGCACFKVNSVVRSAGGTLESGKVGYTLGQDGKSRGVLLWNDHLEEERPQDVDHAGDGGGKQVEYVVTHVAQLFRRVLLLFTGRHFGLLGDLRAVNLGLYISERALRHNKLNRYAASLHAYGPLVRKDQREQTQRAESRSCLFRKVVLTSHGDNELGQSLFDL